jgi:hypothetical protein
MPVLGAVIGGIASIGGGLIASGGAKSAANTQAQAARDAQAAQERMFQKQIELQEPFRQGGITAQNRLFTLLGLNPNAGQPAVSGGGARQYQTPYGTFNFPGGMGGFGGAGAAPATNAQGIVVDPNSPDFGKYARDFGMQDFQQDPGYAFRLSEGQKAIERSAAARGGLQSGSALKAAARFGQDLGSQEYQNAFNRYQINRSNQLNPLQSLMGAGQSATNVMTGAAGQAGQNQAQNIYGAGQARASGYIGSSNALAGALQGIGNTASNYPLYQAQINNLNRGGTGGFGSGGYGGFGSGPNPDGTMSYGGAFYDPSYNYAGG